MTWKPIPSLALVFKKIYIAMASYRVPKAAYRVTVGSQDGRIRKVRVPS